MALIKIKKPVVSKKPVPSNEVSRLAESVAKGSENRGSKMDQVRVVLAKINAKFKTSKVTMASQMAHVPRIETGWLSFDVVTGGGFPRVRTSQVKGPEHSGKTTILLDTAAAVQRAGGVAVWINGEEFDKGWATQRGVDCDQLVLIPYADGTTMLEQAVELLPVADFMALDSVQTIKTARALETPIGETGYGSGGPQMWGDFNGKVNYQYVHGSQTALVWVSQMRAKVATGWQPPNADKDDGSQVKALLHWKSIDVRFRPGSYLRVEEKGSDFDPYGRKVTVKCEKNKVGPRVGREASYSYIYGDGGPPLVNLHSVDRGEEIVSLARHFDLLTNSGANYTYNGRIVAKGLDNVHDFFRDSDNQAVYDELRSQILELARTSTL